MPLEVTRLPSPMASRQSVLFMNGGMERSRFLFRSVPILDVSAVAQRWGGGKNVRRRAAYH